MKIFILRMFFLILLLGAFEQLLFSQDLIVTADGDSLNCKITKIDEPYTYFTYRHNHQIVITFMPSNQIEYLAYNYYPQAEVSEVLVIEWADYPRFRVALNGGYSYRTVALNSNMPSNLFSYYDELKGGAHLGCEVTYFIYQQLGFGLKYNLFQTSNQLTGEDRLWDGVGAWTNTIRIQYFGPLVNLRLYNANKRNCFVFGMGLGLVAYNENAFYGTKMTCHGYTLGSSWDVGYEISLKKAWALGFQISYILGTLSELDQTIASHRETIKLDSDNLISLSHLDFSLGVRFSK